MKNSTVEFSALSEKDWRIFQEQLVPKMFQTKKEAEELVPMSHFLEMFYRHKALNFPLRLVYAIDTAIRPDFQLWLPSRRVAIELTRIETSQQRRARLLHTKGGKGILDVSSFLANPPSSKLPDIYTRAFCTPSFSTAASVQSQVEAWNELFLKILRGKANKRLSVEFDHGDEDWLLLWDQNSIRPWDLNQRVQQIQETLHLLGREVGFQQVYVLDQDFKWLIGSSCEAGVWNSHVFDPSTD